MNSFDEFDFTKINTDADLFRKGITEQTQAQNVRELKEESPAKITQAQSKILAETSVELSINLGNLMLTIEDLIDLTPGVIFQYEMEKEKFLSINLGDNKIAEGRFVKDKEDLAIEITKVMF